ncbi:hypothetical protein GCM10027037_09510 [Mucilaginibacter koreensis]
MSKFGTYIKSRDFRVNLIAAIGTLIAVLIIAYLSLGYYTRHGSGVPVPALKGLTIDRAMAQLEEQGFRYQIDSVYIQDKAPGTVLEQDPDAGTNVKEGRTIYLTIVTRIAPDVSLPDLDQSTYREAVAILANYGLKVSDTTYTSDIARDRVLAIKFNGQVLKAGDKIPKGSGISLVLGDGAGASEQDIPDLINQDLDAAKFAIKGAGFTLGDITYEGTITDSTTLVVTAQSPMRSDSLAKASIGTRINLTVSQAPKTNEQQQPPPNQQQP